MFRVIVIAMTILCPTLGHSNEKKEGTEQPAETRRDASSQNKMSPDRRSNISEIGFDIRPSVLFSEGETATGIIGDLSYTYYGKAFFVGFQLHPMRFTSFAGSPVGSFGTVVEGGYDSRFLMIGAGAGVRFYVAYVGPTTPGLVLSVPLRLGEKDGLNFKTTTAFAGETGASGMGWYDTQGELTIPVTQKTAILVDGAGGKERAFSKGVGYWYGTVGVARWLTVKGDSRALKLSLALGASGVWYRSTSISGYAENINGQIIESEEEVHENTHSGVGPLLGFGVIYRF